MFTGFIAAPRKLTHYERIYASFVRLLQIRRSLSLNRYQGVHPHPGSRRLFILFHSASPTIRVVCSRFVHRFPRSTTPSITRGFRTWEGTVTCGKPDPTYRLSKVLTGGSVCHLFAHRPSGYRTVPPPPVRQQEPLLRAKLVRTPTNLRGLAIELLSLPLHIYLDPSHNPRHPAAPAASRMVPRPF